MPRKKFLNSKTTHDYYYHYKYKQVCTAKIKLFDYKTLCGIYNKFLANRLIDGKDIILAGELGAILIRGKKENPKVINNNIYGLALDKKATLELWNKNKEAKEKKEKLYIMNDRTNYIRYNVVYEPCIYSVKHLYLYSFKLALGAKKKLKEAILEGQEYAMKYINK